jgi:hypothetical protein
MRQFAGMAETQVGLLLCGMILSRRLFVENG